MTLFAAPVPTMMLPCTPTTSTWCLGLSEKQVLDSLHTLLTGNMGTQQPRQRRPAGTVFLLASRG